MFYKFDHMQNTPPLKNLTPYFTQTIYLHNEEMQYIRQ